VSFQHPVALWLLLLIPALFAFYFQALKRKKQAALRFSSLGLIKSAGHAVSWRRDIIFYMTLAALAILIFGLSDPHIPLKRSQEGVNVVLVLDVSGSMQATDYKPSRIEAARNSARVLLQDLQPKDNAGIVIFESGATTAAYLSPFKDRVIEKLDGVRVKEGRTAIGDGLSLGVDMAISVPNKRKVVVLLSDGVNNAGVISPAEAIAFAKTNKVQVNVVGMGTEGKTELGRDMFGRPVYAELDEASLKAIADETGGKYYKSVDTETLEDIYSRISKDIEREKEEVSIKDWLIIAAALILLAELYIRYGRYRIISG
jgi:Ca-activated chloride channel family protein